MSDYIVSARKYRPDSFETLIGQDNIAQTLKNSILRGQIAHAYLFCGPRGVGKTSMARLFAKAINCSNPSADMEPCGECESCVSFREGRSYCIHELDAASNNGVEDIKALMEQVQVPPQVGKYGVYIIDEVHMLSQAAFNAFLKTLEEPPAHAIFILATTEKHKIIPTVLSRCQTYDFNRISIKDMVRNLSGIAAKEGIRIDDDSLHIIAQKADGAMRDALTIFDQTVAFCGTDIKREDVIRNLNVLDYEYSFRLVDAFLAGDYPTALLAFDEILAKGFNAMHFVGSLSSHLRDLIVCRTAGLDSLLDLSDSLKERYREQSARCSLKFLYDALAATVQCEAGYKAATNPRLHIEFTLMKLSFLNGMPATAATAQKPQNATPAAPKEPAAPKPSETPAPAPNPAPAPVEPAPAAPAPAPQQSAPALEAAPQAPQAPQTPRRRNANAASSLSFSSMMGKKQENTITEETDKGRDVSEAEIIEKWNTLAESYFAIQPRLSNALKTASVEISEDEGVKKLTFMVVNEGQQKWIREQKLLELEGKMRELLRTSKIKLDIGVKQAEAIEEKPYMPSEQAADLIAHNESIKDLVIDLGLDIK